MQPTAPPASIPGAPVLPPTAPPPSSPSFPPPATPSFPPPSTATVYVVNETDLAQQIRAVTTVPTNLMLPATLLITMPLPPVLGPVQLLSNNTSSNTQISCSTSNFTVLTVVSGSLSMTGISWTGCGTVMVVKAAAGAAASISVTDCSFQGNTGDPAAAASCIDATQAFSGGLTITNSTFIGNGVSGDASLAPAGPSVAVDCSGAGASTTCGVTVEASLFDGNSGSQVGALLTTCDVQSTCSVAIVRSTFSNHASGAVSVLGDWSVTMGDSTFESNLAMSSGGAVRVEGISQSQNMTMNDCTFENCASLAGGGGALFITGLANFSILSSTFVNCSAWVAGGAVYATNSASATLNGNTFTGCAAGILPDGVWPSFTPAITASTSDAITSQTGGGGLFASAVQTVLIQACTFQACSAVRGGGGGCHVRSGTIVQFLTSSFTSCSAAYGGALAVISMHPAQGQNSNIFSANFTGNVADSALLCPSRICNVYQSPSASGSGDGGAIYMEGFTVQVGYAGFGTSTSFLANHATNRGGAIFCQHPSDRSYLQLTVSGDVQPPSMTAALPGLAVQPRPYYTSFVNNSAGVAGGAIGARSYKFSIIATILPDGAFDLNVYTLFQGNSAPIAGAILLIDVSAELSMALFINNSATLSSVATSGGSSYACGLGQGGAVCIVGDSLTNVSASSLLFYNNTAAFGGAMSLHASPSCTPQQTQTGCFTASLDASSDFQGNSAVDGAGGAIFWSHPGNLHLSCNGSEYVPPRTSGAAEFPDVPVDVQPCSSWGNNTVSSLGYGPVIASTPFYLRPGIKSLPFYSSNQPLLLNVTMQRKSFLHYDQ
ncbi:MAG: hypothetical protein WDW38_011273 [Sanguina aurantia]